jgi:indolepyruvate ferredoxin oxidoreductase beta subunit
MNATVYNILFCGIGGQGILKASEVTGIAAMLAGFHVKKSEVHGMSQRGGSVESHLRFGGNIWSPLIEPGCADYLVCFHPEEGERMSFYLKQGGVDFRAYLETAEREIPNPRFLNTWLTGVLSLYLPVEERMWLDALERVLPRALNENIEVFQTARQKGKSV